jgi:hypothetical protein
MNQGKRRAAKLHKERQCVRENVSRAREREVVDAPVSSARLARGEGTALREWTVCASEESSPVFAFSCWRKHVNHGNTSG